MRQIWRIAKTELAVLFYSPVAWFLLVCFAVQCGLGLENILDQIVGAKTMGRIITFSVTNGIVLGTSGIFESIQSTIYLYIPLLTMGLLSREISSGSIKLLLSSPLSATQVVLGKFLSMVVMSAILTGILGLSIGVMIFGVPSWDAGTVFCGLLGIFLMLCTYSAIGLFMSSLTSYQVVAAVSTFAILAFLAFADRIGQTNRVVKDIMYWLSISGRSSEFIGGLLTSEDLLYFIMVSGLFIGWTILQISGMSTVRSPWRSASLYGSILAAVLLSGWATTLPQMKFYKDFSRDGQRTLADGSVETLSRIKGPIRIDTYVNIHDFEYKNINPSTENQDRERFEKYIRFMPQMQLKWHYYEKTDEIDDYIDRTRNDPGCFRVLTDLATGRQAFLYNYNDLDHYPSESEITTALKVLLEQPVNAVVVTGHGSRSCFNPGDRDFSALTSDCHFRYSMINRGCNVSEIDLSVSGVPDSTEILCIADPRTPFSAEELESIREYIESGRNMVVLTDNGNQETIAPVLAMLGLRAEKGSIAQDNPGFATNAIQCQPSDTAISVMGGAFKIMKQRGKVFAMEGAAALTKIEDCGFSVLPQMTAAGWIETSDYDPEIDRAVLNPDKGEKMDTLVTAMFLSRSVDGKEQKIIVSGDADCISNKELQMEGLRRGASYANFSATSSLLRYLSDKRFPISVGRPPYKDKDITITPLQLQWIYDIYKIFIPLLLALAGIVTLLLRHRH